MNKQTVLTGITTTGTPHLGNYVGAIRPAILASQSSSFDAYYFLADYHAIIKCQEPERIRRSTLEIAATWLALGLDPKRVTFYRQSDIPEILELCWILSCNTAKGLMNRSHAYKAAVADNQAQSETEIDKGITMGLFNYPILMAADILMFCAHKVPVGKDQIQHVEMARDIAGRFNHHYGEHFILPEAVVSEHVAVLPGLDGRKMSKSYGNTIPLFAEEKQLRALIMKITTNSLPPEAPKDPEGCTLFSLYQAFATPEETALMRKRYATGIGWGAMKQQLFEYINEHLRDARASYQAWMADPKAIERILHDGANRARSVATPFLKTLRQAIGID